MPEPTPTTDVSSETKPKKPSPIIIIALVGGGVVLFILYKRKKAKEEEEKQGSFVEATTGGQNAEAVSPEASGGNLVNAAQNLQRENTEFLDSVIDEENKKPEEGPKTLPEQGNIDRRGRRQGNGTEITGSKGGIERAHEHPPIVIPPSVPNPPQPKERPKPPILPGIPPIDWRVR